MTWSHPVIQVYRPSPGSPPPASYQTHTAHLEMHLLTNLAKLLPVEREAQAWCMSLKEKQMLEASKTDHRGT